MKKDFFDYMLEVMNREPKVYLLFIGLGYPRVDEFLKRFPTRAINTEAAEQTALDIAVGLAYQDKIPFTYTISPFYLRAFETLRTYINHERLNVKMIGAGRNDDYSKHDGFSHEAGDLPEILGTLKNIDQYYPENKGDLIKAIDRSLVILGPAYINVTK